MRGPRGVGFLYVREEVIDQLEPPMLDLHAAEWTSADGYRLRADAKRFENWEKNYANHLGMGVAVDYALEIGLDRIWAQVERNAVLLRERLSAVPGVTVRDLGEVKGGIVDLRDSRSRPGCR